MVIALCARRALLSKSTFLKVPKRNGYFVLVPEVGDDSSEKEPLLGADKLPDFKQITSENCIAAIARQAVEFEENVRAIGERVKGADGDVFVDALLPLEEAYIPLETTFGISQLLFVANQSRLPAKAYGTIVERAKLAQATRFVCEPIFVACRKALEDKSAKLTDEQKRLLEKFLLEGKLNALHLDQRKRSKLGYYHSLLMQRRMEYTQKIQIQTNKFSYTISDPEYVKNFSPEFLQRITINPDHTRGPWRLTLDPYVVDYFLEHGRERHVRWLVWEAYVTRASMHDDRLYRVSTALEEIRDKRQMKAELLGYKTYADLSMESKMAGSLDKVTGTLEELRKIARPVQDREIKELNEYASQRDFNDTVKMWDVSYWIRVHRLEKYNYDPATVREYFPLPTVLLGLSNFLEAMFSVRLVERQMAGAWHKDVRFYDVFDMKQSSTEPIAHFYLDPYIRMADKKHLQGNTGQIVTIRRGSKRSNLKPLYAMIFNLPSPTTETPSLLSLNDLKSLFQMFGHLMQRLLSQSEYSEISGLSFVEWDAAHISDFFLLNWLYEPSVLEQISGHWATNERLPKELIETVRSMRSHFAGFELCKKLYYAQLDLELHTSNLYWLDVVRRMWDKYFALPLHKKDSHVCSFEAIFSGTAAAAFYSPLWSEMIAADLFSAYLEQPHRTIQEQKQICDKFRETFLSLSSICPANELFRRFRGRDPSEQALLSSLGLSKDTSIDYQ